MKYDWSNVPEGYNFVAMDADGSVLAFVHKPIPYGGMWHRTSDKLAIRIGQMDFNWRTSLEERVAYARYNPYKETNVK